MGAPGQAQCVLALFEARHGHPTGIGGLGGAIQDASVQKGAHAVPVRGHVRAFAHGAYAVVHQCLRIFATDLVLGGAGHGDVNGHPPWPLALVEADVIEAIRHLGDAAAALFLEFANELQQIVVQAAWDVNEAGGVRQGDHSCPEGDRFLGGVDGHVAGTRNRHRFPFDAVPGVVEHVFAEVHATVPSGFRAHQAAAEVQALAGQDAGVAVRQAQVLPEQHADFPGADANVASGNVGVLADVPMELDHQRLAKAFHLAVALALGVEV